MVDLTASRERRLHLRAFDYWQQIKGDEDQPFFKDLTVEGLAPYKDQSLLVERHPAAEGQQSAITVRFFGTNLATLFPRRPTVGDDFRAFSDSGFAQELLSLLDNPSATDRAAEFEYVDLEVDSRGVMLPLSRTGETIDFLWVVISAKTYADMDDPTEPTADEPLEPPQVDDGPTPEPIDMKADSLVSADLADVGPDPGDSETPEPGYDLSEAVSDSLSVDLDLDPPAIEAPAPALSEPATAVPGLFLEGAQDLAEDHKSSTAPGFERLYRLLSDALRVYEEAQSDPGPLHAALEAAGLKTQSRAPYTPILKLIFGKDYDKTRLTEYGSAISFAVREGVTSGGLVTFLREYPGGIKGCVRAERMARRGDKTTTAHSRLKAAKRRLRDAQGQPLETVKLTSEFDLVMVRRDSGGGPVVLGRVDVTEPTMSALIERQARRIRRRRSEPKD